MCSNKEYLKKYLSDGTGDKKKKRRIEKPGRVKIFDDDIDAKQLIPKNIKNTIDEDIGADKPLVADFVDERPKEVIELEKFRQSSFWKIVGQSGDSSSTDKGNRNSVHLPGRSPRHDSDSAASPVRTNSSNLSGGNTRHDSDSDASPVRTKSSNLPGGNTRHDSDSDASPVRTKSTNVPGGNTRHDSDSDTSENRFSVNRQRHDTSDSDLSPPPRRKEDSMQSSNNAQALIGNFGSRNKAKSGEQPSKRCVSPSILETDHQRKHRRSGTDSDLSPERGGQNARGHQRHDKNRTLSQRGHGSDSDLSPERPRNQSSRSTQKVSASSSNRSRNLESHAHRNDSDADLSPERKRPNASLGRSSPGRPYTVKGSRNEQDLSPVRKSVTDRLSGKEKATKTLAGAKAGLQSASDMKIEAKELRRKEELAFAKISDELSGRNAATVLRDKTTGRRRNLAEEQALKDKEDAVKNVTAAKYQEWNKGLKQAELKEAMLADAIHEVEKPLARYRDDADLDAILREQERAEDPMLAYIKKKKAKNVGPVKPRYKGPEPPPNRFNIWPGYRWDGVDRSNGFERLYFASLANKKAVKDIAYKWSVEDM